MKALHQLVPSLHPGDAVSNHALEVQRLLREMGLESEIFVEGVHPSLRRRTHPFDKLPGKLRPGDGVMYQMAIGSPVAEILHDLPARLFLNYHNVTPGEYFRPWDPREGLLTRRGRRQLAALAPKVELALAVSEFNAAELRAAGYAHTVVSPLLLDLHRFEREADHRLEERLRREKRGTDLLFVGRMVPHKCHQDLVKALAAYRRGYDPEARLFLVGGGGPAAYRETLERYVAELGLGDAVVFAGRVSDAELAAHYRAADVFVCLSEHEGFCIPLLEAMHHRIPIVAFEAAAVPETLDGAGVLLPEKRLATVAAAVHRVVTDDVLRQALVDRGTQRLADFSLEKSRATFAQAVRSDLERAV